MTKKSRGSGWHGEHRRHVLAGKGVGTKLPDGRRLAVNNFVAGGVNKRYVLDGIDQALMYAYDVEFKISRDGVRSTIFFEQHPDYRNALNFHITNDDMDEEWNNTVRWSREWKLNYPIENMESANDVIEWLVGINLVR